VVTEEEGERIVSTTLSARKPPGWLKPANRLVVALQRFGLVIGPMHLLSVPGRKSGRMRTSRSRRSAWAVDATQWPYSRGRSGSRTPGPPAGGCSPAGAGTSGWASSSCRARGGPRCCARFRARYHRRPGSYGSGTESRTSRRRSRRWRLGALCSASIAFPRKIPPVPPMKIRRVRHARRNGT
jgi:hypothetical protein